MVGPKLNAEAAMMQADQSEALKRKLGLDQLRRQLATGETEEKKLRKACEGFEAVFINKLWKQMRTNVPQEGYLHSREEKFYVGMFDQKLAEKLADSGGVGIGDMLFNQLREQLLDGSRTARTVRKSPEELNPLEMPERADAAQASGIHIKKKPPLEVVSEPEEGGAARPAAPAPEPMREPQAVVDDAAVVASVKKDRLPAAAPPELMAKAMQLAASIEYQHARTSASAPPDLNAAATPASAAPVERGTLSWPALGTVQGEFGWRTDPVTGAREWHPGLDIAGREGDPIAACWGGKVVFAGEQGRYGQTVVIEHPGGWRSMYGHNQKNLVEIGQVVEAGQKIATMGDTGSAPGTILHFELRQGDQAMNPERVRETMQAVASADDNA